MEQIAIPQTGATVDDALRKLDPGNRFRMMFGLDLLPENGVVPEMPEYKPQQLWDVPLARK